jgi:hypothetical protein
MFLVVLGPSTYRIVKPLVCHNGQLDIVVQHQDPTRPAWFGECSCVDVKHRVQDIEAITFDTEAMVQLGKALIQYVSKHKRHVYLMAACETDMVLMADGLHVVVWKACLCVCGQYRYPFIKDSHS